MASPKRAALAVLAILLLSVSSGLGADRLYWNPPAAAAGQATAGTWDNTSANWNTAADGSGTEKPWTAGATAVFAPKTKTLVAVAGTVAVSAIEFSGAACDIAGDTLQIDPTGLDVRCDADATLSAKITGPGRLKKRGNAMLTVTGGNDFSGGTEIDGGSVRLMTSTSTGTGDVAVLQTAGLLAGADNLKLGNALQVARGAVLTMDLEKLSDLEWTGAMTGNGAVRKVGTGTLTITGAFSLAGGFENGAGPAFFLPTAPFAGPITISGGLLRVARNSLAKGASIAVHGAGALAASGECDGVTAWLMSGYLAAGSDGTLAVDGGREVTDTIDFSTAGSSFPDLALGACDEAIISGEIRPFRGVLHLGGGGGELVVKSVIGGDKRVVIGHPGSEGGVTLSGRNTFTGGIQILGCVLRAGADGALPPGEIQLGGPGGDEFSCALDTHGFVVSNPVRMQNRATLENSTGSPGALTGAISAGNYLLHLVAGAGSVLEVRSAITSAATIVASRVAPRMEAEPDVIALDPAQPNTCSRLQVEGGVVLRARDGLGLPAGARLVVNGGVFESTGEFTRNLVANHAKNDGAGGVSLNWNSGGQTGFSAHGGPLKVTLTGPPTLAWGAVRGHYRLVLNAPTADSMITFALPIDLAGETGDRKNLPTAAHEIAVYSGTAVLAGAITNSGTSPAGIAKFGGGTLKLAGANTFDGAIQLREGSLVFQNPGAIPGTGRSIEPEAGTIVGTDYPMDDAFLQRIASPNATPFVLALGGNSYRPMDFNSDDGCVLRAASLGATGRATYSGTLTPCDGIVRLGGGKGTLTVTAPALVPTVIGGAEGGRVVLPAGTALPEDAVLQSGDVVIGQAPWTPPARPKAVVPTPDEATARLKAAMAAPYRNTGRDIEAEVRARFPGSGDARNYHANDPEQLVTYTDAEKQAQRDRATAMFESLQEAAANSDGPRDFTIPSCVYRIRPNQMVLENVTNFTIHGPGAEFIQDGLGGGSAFSFVNCSGIVLTGRPAPGTKTEGLEPELSFDSEQLPASLARIVGLNVADATLDVEIQPGYRTELPVTERMMAYNPQGRMVNLEQMGWQGVTPLGGNFFRLASPSVRNLHAQNTVLKPGNLLTLHRGDEYEHHVYSASRCRDMTYESIRVYDGGGAPGDHGTAGQTVYRDWRLIPRPGTNRLEITAGLGQFSKDGGQFVFDQCEFGPHLDDGINLSGGLSVTERQDSSRSVVVTGYLAPTPGSTLTFYDYDSWAKLGEAKVVTASALREPETLAAANAHATANHTNPNARQAWRVTLDGEVTLTPFAMVVHSNYRADSLMVRDSLFRDQLAQIMLIQGAKSGDIEDNLLLRSTGPAVSLQFSQYWWEGPMPSNFIVRDNVIRDNPVDAAVSGQEGGGSISVWPGTMRETHEQLMDGFLIEGNTIVNSSGPGIVVRNAGDVMIRHNRIINSGAQKIENIFRRQAAWKWNAGIVLDSVSHASVTDNMVTIESPWCPRVISTEPGCDLSTIRIEGNTPQPQGP